MKSQREPLHQSKIFRSDSDAALAYEARVLKVLLVLVLGFLCGIGLLSYRNLQSAAQSAALETHTRMVIQEFGDLLSSLKDAETGQRGFIITGSPSYLELYEISTVETWSHLAELRRLTADNYYQLQRLEVIMRLVKDKFAELKATIQLRQTKGFAAARDVVIADAGGYLMDQIRVQGAIAGIEEQKILKERISQKQADTRHVYQSVLLSALLGTLTVTLLLIYVSLKLTRQLKLNAAWQASEKRYAQLFNSLTQGFCIIEKCVGKAGELLDFLYIQANPAFAVQTGLSGVVGKTLRQVLPDESEKWLLTYDAVLRTGKPISFERALIAQGRVLELYAFRVEDKTCKRVGVSFTDITERQQSQNALRQGDERYRNLFNSIDEGCATLEVIFNAEEKIINFRILEVNRAFEKQTGLQVTAGKLLREIAPGYDAHWSEVFGQVALTGKSVRFVSESGASDGRWFDVFAMSVSNSTHKKVVVLFKDITKRIQSDLAVRQSAARFRALFDHGPIAMFSVDALGIIQEFNRHAVVMWRSSPSRGDFLENFCDSFKLHRPDGSYLPHSQTPVAAVLRGDLSKADDIEIIMERPDGSIITVISNVVPLKNSQGEITGAITCMYDITERSRLERQTLEHTKALTDLDRRKDEFLAMLSHELRNPLAAIFNAIQLLRRQKNEDPLLKQGRNIIARQVKQLKFLVNDLMEVSRFSTGNILLRRKPVSVSRAIGRAVEAVRPLILQRRQVIDVSLPLEPVFLYADARRIHQVLVNLLTNAAKYTDIGGNITVTVTQENGYAELRVRDTGIGIAPDLLPHIFELFTQAERSLDRSQGGLGIGLCLVQQLVQLHGGTVAACSVLGQGSEFLVRLPLINAGMQNVPLISPVLTVMSEGTTSPALDDVSSSLTKSCRVLVVDDNVDAAQSLAVLLEMSGHEVKLAYDGPSATHAALAYKPEVVLLDIGLPGLDGYQVARWIRKQESIKNVLLIAVTGYGQDSDRKHSKEAGFDHHLVKPVEFDEVERLLANDPKMLTR